MHFDLASRRIHVSIMFPKKEDSLDRPIDNWHHTLNAHLEKRIMNIIYNGYVIFRNYAGITQKGNVSYKKYIMMPYK